MCIRDSADPLTTETTPELFAPWPTARLALDLELYSSARWTHQTTDDLTELRLDRGELGARIDRAGAPLGLRGQRRGPALSRAQHRQDHDGRARGRCGPDAGRAARGCRGLSLI